MNKKQRKFKRKQQRASGKSSPRQGAHIQIKTSGPLPQQGMPLWTMTGELFQPVRIHYAVLKLEKVLKLFNKLRCLEFDPRSKQWQWLYTGEAGTLAFEKRPVNAAKPIVLGSILFQGEHHLYLDVHSIERALEAIPFFDRYLSRKVAQITHLSVVNRLFAMHEAHAFTFDPSIPPNSVVEDPIQTMLHTLDALSAQVKREQEKTALIVAYLARHAQKRFPEVEHIAVHYYQEGIQQPWFVLGSRQYIAIQHWKGNAAYNQADYIREVVHSVGEIQR